MEDQLLLDKVLYYLENQKEFRTIDLSNFTPSELRGRADAIEQKELVINEFKEYIKK